jgi:hypothetical protein
MFKVTYATIGIACDLPGNAILPICTFTTATPIYLEQNSVSQRNPNQKAMHFSWKNPLQVGSLFIDARMVSERDCCSGGERLGKVL